ncbi:hypothetical protein [Barrientosiimonas endolithica]|uniref:hypothetical protein n=1 Tax=Barrientosiimonas endolithica TaxID=1535208 RepID=UPI00259BF11A|nr:hypothetical protein [Barrientosiimonas endolithica]
MIGRLRLVGVGEKMTRRLAAVVLAGQAFALFFGALSAWGMSRTQEGSPRRRTCSWGWASRCCASRWPGCSAGRTA